MATATIDRIDSAPRFDKRGDVVVIGPNAQAFSTETCEVCEEHIPLARYFAATQRPGGVARYCSEKCMRTADMREYRKNKRGG